MIKPEQPAICVHREPPKTIDEVKAIVLAEFKYWEKAEAEREGELIFMGAVAATANILAALSGMYAPWHPKPDK